MGQTGQITQLSSLQKSVLTVQDCDGAPDSESLLNYPSGLLNYDELMEFFQQEFGYTEREVTALMGAHTLGAADIFNSGFNGVWVSNEAVMLL